MSTFNHHFLCIQEHQQVHIYWPYFRQNYEYHRFDITYVLGNKNDKRVTIKNSKLEMKRHKTVKTKLHMLSTRSPTKLRE